tara:strand:+ start:335 stop:511 length:177 start_codon:yes stop_codon:yes gene_type:complete
MTNYQSALARIARAKTLADLSRCEDGFGRVYEAGHLTARELMRLDVMIHDKRIQLFDA